MFSAPHERWEAYAPHLRAAFDAASLNVHLAPDLPPDQVDYVIYAPRGDLDDFTPYTRCKAVLSLWAGVEQIVGNDTLTMPLTRMVDPGLTRGMVEWVTGHVLRYHLDMDRDIIRTDAQWDVHVPPLAAERSVVVLGLGALGLAVAETLKGIGFDVSGWSRTAKSIPGMRTFHEPGGLTAALSRAEIAILLLPDTPATENTLNAHTLAQMPKGGRIINPGRGALIDDDALLEALDARHIAHATLDVFRVEPLPADHPFWSHPNITVTPHIAAETRAGTASQVIAENIRRCEAGQSLLHLVDRQTGY
nr:glyoxylate/hydroxypyruvate reductase A [Sulfitobacter aestuariivivens]